MWFEAREGAIANLQRQPFLRVDSHSYRICSAGFT